MEYIKENLGIIIPYYNASEHINNVVSTALSYSNYIVIVDDKSEEPLPEKLLGMAEVVVLKSPKNLGVGGATKLGFGYFQTLENIQVILKLDADDQMDTNYIPAMFEDIIAGNCQFVKGNRFRDFKALQKMPVLRRFGNLWLSFLSKAATGYWNCFDFNNGYFAIATKTLKNIDKESLSDNYYFETSLISSLYYQRTRIKEIAMPAIYGTEKSNMKLFKMPAHFTINLVKTFFERIWKTYFVYDFNIGTIYILFGIPLFLGGVVFGSINWYHYASINQFTPLGTIMISALLIILGFQLLLQAVQFDIFLTPKKHNND
jgi:hypothetical protein